MLKGAGLVYRGDLIVRGPSQATRHKCLPQEKNLLCINVDNGHIYRPEDQALVTFLGSVIEHLISKPVQNAVSHGDRVPLLFETRQETALARAMRASEFADADVKAALGGRAVVTHEPQLARLVCETLRIVTDYTHDRLHNNRKEMMLVDEILTSVKVDRTADSIAA